MHTLIAGNVLWSYDYEILEKDETGNLGYLFSTIRPFHTHAGDIILTHKKIIITGDENLVIPFKFINQISLGYDEIFRRVLANNLGFLWQPLRFELSDRRMYCIIDHNILGMTKNSYWFQALKNILSEKPAES